MSTLTLLQTPSNFTSTARAAFIPLESLQYASKLAQKPSEPMKCKRKINFGGKKSSPAPSVSKRNARERNRVSMVNKGFETLRDRVPTTSKNKKLSKVETLRSAVEYIKQLKSLIESQGGSFEMPEIPQGSSSPELSPAPIDSPMSYGQGSPFVVSLQNVDASYYSPLSIPDSQALSSSPASSSPSSPPEYTTLANLSPSGSDGHSPTSSYFSDNSNFENFSPAMLENIHNWFS